MHAVGFPEGKETTVETGSEREKINKDKEPFFKTRENFRATELKKWRWLYHILPGGAGEILPSSFIHFSIYLAQYVKTEYLYKGAAIWTAI